jgi:hypothetical protein
LRPTPETDINSSDAASNTSVRHPKREVKPSGGLALDERKVTNRIVACVKMGLVNVNTKLNEFSWHAACALVTIDDDVHSLSVPQPLHPSSNLDTKASTSDFAGL